MEKEKFCKEIVECLIKYGRLRREDAQSLVSSSNICATESDEDVDLLWHETPYYWAMWLLHSKKTPDWHKNPNLWPPPKEYLDKRYDAK